MPDQMPEPIVDINRVVAVLQQEFPKEWTLAFQKVLIDQLSEQNQQLSQALAATNGASVLAET